MTDRHFLARLGAAALTLALSACAYSPGVSIGDRFEASFRPNAKLGGTAPSAETWPSWLRWGKSAEPAVVQAADTPSPPPGMLVSITPELIRQLRQARPTDVPEDVKNLFGKAKAYRIGPGDVLGVTVWSHPEISFTPSAPLTQLDPTGQSALANGFSVNFDGFIQFPFVGSVKVAGLTEQQAQELLLRVSAKYLKSPQMTVRVVAYRSGRVYVDGEVRTPGLQAVTDVALTLPDAIARAGGMTPTADRSAVAITRDGKTTLINLTQLTEMGVNPNNILLAGGDLVRVLNRDDTKVYVLGEVLKPAPQLMRNGRLTLNEALGEAGGVNQVSGDPRQIYVIRNGATGNPEIYHLNARNPMAFAMADFFELRPRDVVFVDPAPLVNWNRAISLLVPSGSLLGTASTLIK